MMAPSSFLMLMRPVLSSLITVVFDFRLILTSVALVVAVVVVGGALVLLLLLVVFCLYCCVVVVVVLAAVVVVGVIVDAGPVFTDPVVDTVDAPVVVLDISSSLSPVVVTGVSNL